MLVLPTAESPMTATLAIESNYRFFIIIINTDAI